MVGVGDTHVGGGAGGDVGDDVVINFAVVGVQAQLHVDVGVKLLKVGNGLLVDVGLALIGVVFGPEGDLIGAALIKGVWHLKACRLLGAVAAGESQQQGGGEQGRTDAFSSHPLIPPLDTPAMIFFRNRKNSRMRGTEMTTTAAIMAGMFSRPKPFSRISWIPLDTRK